MKVLEPRSRRSPRSPRRMANLTGLRVFTKYEIKVAAATNYTGNYSQPINVTTREGGEVNTFHGGRVQLF